MRLLHLCINLHGIDPLPALHHKHAGGQKWALIRTQAHFPVPYRDFSISHSQRSWNSSSSAPSLSLYIHVYCITLASRTLSTLFNCVYMCVSWAHHCVLFPWLGGSCHAFANQYPKMCPSRLVYTKVTYPATISACSGSDQATAVGCKRAWRAS